MADKFAGGVKAGATGVSIPVLLRKTADSTEQTGILAASVTATYRRAGAAAVDITVSDLAAITSAWSSGGWKEAEATKQPGTYRLDVPDAAFAAGAEWVIVAVKVASTFVFYERFNLETAGAAEVYARIGAPTGASIAADIATRLAAAGYTAPDNATIGAIAQYVDTEIATIISRLGSPAGVSLSADVAAVKADTGNLTTRLPSALSFTGGNVNANVAAITNAVITDAAFTVPGEVVGQPTGILGFIRRVYERGTNKRTRDRSNGVVALRNAADTGNLETKTQSTTTTVDTIA